jgi:hypothetical protein
MIIRDLDRGGSRISGTICWEVAARKSFEAYIQLAGQSEETEDSHRLSHPFLVAALLPAMRHGENRVRVEKGSVDPFLLEQLRSVVALAHAWWGDGPHYEPIDIEAEVADQKEPKLDRVAASFLTGGVDSLATLRNNRLSIPRSHPQSIEKNILVYGVDIGLGGQSSEEEDTSTQKFQEVERALTPITQSAGTALIPVYTNLRHLDDDNDFYTRKWHGSLLAAVAHALSKEVHTAYIGSTFDFENVTTWGSTPLMDPLFSGSSLRIEHDGARLSRLEKVRLLSSWPEAINSVRVCFVNRPGELNCGRCEKCIRTKLELAAVGKLDASEAFSASEISPELVSEELQILSPFAAVCYEEVVEPLRERGRGKVADALETKLRNYRAIRRRVEERDWRGVIKRGLRYFNLYQ